MCCTWLAANTGRKKVAKNRHLGTIAQLHQAISSQLRHKSTIGKNLLSSNTFSTCPYNMVNFGPLVAEILSLVWGTPANFNGFRVLASLLQRRCSTEVNQTLHCVWPSPGLVHYIYTFGISCLLTEFCHVQNSLSVHLRTIVQVSRAISSQLRHLSTIGKKLTKQQYVRQMSPQYSELRPLVAEISPVVWGTPANFNGFRVLAALLHGIRAVGASQTLCR